MSASIATAHVSGPLGQALAVVDGETWLFDMRRPRRRPTANDIRFFFDFGLEVRPLAPVETLGRGVEDLRSVLEAETHRFRALRCVLDGMDSELDDDLRLRSMRRGESLLCDSAVGAFVEHRFLRPADKAAWNVSHALTLARDAGLRRVARLYAVVDGPCLRELEDHVREWVAAHGRPSIEGAAAVRTAYESGLIAALATAMQDGDRARIQGLVFRAKDAGWDSHLVAHLVNFAAPRQATRQEIRREPEEPELPSDTGLSPIERVNARVETALRARRSHGSRDRRHVNRETAPPVDAVLRQVEWIVGQFQTGHDTVAWDAVGNLAQRQLGRGGADYFAQSLTNIASRIQGRFANADALYALAQRCAPDAPTVWCAHANLLGKSGRLPEALAAYDAAVERFPENAFARTGRAETLRALGRLPEALAAYDAAVERFPENAVARNGRAETLRALGRLPEALAAYDAAVERFPENAVARTGRAETLRALGRLSDALSAYDEAVARFPDNAVARNGRATVLVELGRTEDARASLRHAGENPAAQTDWVAAHILCMIDLRAGATVELAERLRQLAASCPFVLQRRYFQTTLAVARIALTQYTEARTELAILSGDNQIADDERQVLRLIEAHAEAADGDLAAARRSMAVAAEAISFHDFQTRLLQGEIVYRYGLGEKEPPVRADDIHRSDMKITTLEMACLAACVVRTGAYASSMH